MKKCFSVKVMSTVYRTWVKLLISLLFFVKWHSHWFWKKRNRFCCLRAVRQLEYIPLARSHNNTVTWLLLFAFYLGGIWMIRCISQDHWHRQGSGLDPRIACVFSVLFVTSHRFSRVLAHVAVMNGIKSSEFFMNMCSSSKITSCRKVLIVISTNDNWKNAFFSSITTAPGLFCLHDISILSAARTALDV